MTPHGRVLTGFRVSISSVFLIAFTSFKGTISRKDPKPPAAPIQKSSEWAPTTSSARVFWKYVGKLAIKEPAEAANAFVIARVLKIDERLSIFVLSEM